MNERLPCGCEARQVARPAGSVFPFGMVITKRCGPHAAERLAAVERFKGILAEEQADEAACPDCVPHAPCDTHRGIRKLVAFEPA